MPATAAGRLDEHGWRHAARVLAGLTVGAALIVAGRLLEAVDDNIAPLDD